MQTVEVHNGAGTETRDPLAGTPAFIMDAIVDNSRLGPIIQEKILHLLDTQPDITPDTLHCISAKRPEQTPEEIEANLKVLKEKVQPFKVEVPADPANPPPEGAPPEDILPAEVEGDMGDLLQDLNLLERAGMGFGKDVALRLFLSLKKLLFKNPGTTEPEKITRVRLWGKIYGLDSDYIVAETVISDRLPNPPLPEGEPNPAIVPPDPVRSDYADFMTSTNDFVYFVCAEPGQPWQRLPDVQPSTLRASQGIRRFFTGDLTAKVASKGPFPGKEADYLRAQIARITADCRLAPRGHLADTTDYEGGGELQVQQSEEGTFFGMTGAELCELHKSAWVHSTLDVLPQGRSMYYNYGWTPPDDNPEAKDPRLEKNRPALASIHRDKAGMLGAPAWSAHLCGIRNSPFSSAVVRSNVWPGACTVGWGYTFANFYLGWGQRQTGAMFAPALSWSPPVEADQKEFARNDKCKGRVESGDFNLAPLPPPEEEAPPA